MALVRSILDIFRTSMKAGRLIPARIVRTVPTATAQGVRILWRCQYACLYAGNRDQMSSSHGS